MLQPTDFALIVAAARREVEKALASKDRAALEAFAPSFTMKDGHLWMQHGANVADLGHVIGPRGIDGFNGIDGKSGIDGLDGKNGVDGTNGIDGLEGKAGRDGVDGRDGIDGKDGVGVAGAYISDKGFLIIELTDGRKITAGKVRGKDGKDGVTAYTYMGGGAGSSSGGGGGGPVAWDDVTGKPATFPPSAHTHVIADVTGLQAALDGKQDALVSGTNIKTVNGESLLGSGNIVISGGAGIGGTAVLSFGAAPGSSYTTETTAAVGVTAASRVKVWVQGTTVDHNAIEHLIIGGRMGLYAIPSTGSIEIHAETELRLSGDVAIIWEAS